MEEADQFRSVQVCVTLGQDSLMIINDSLEPLCFTVKIVWSCIAGDRINISIMTDF
jgi:hypothetical protein